MLISQTDTRTRSAPGITVQREHKKAFLGKSRQRLRQSFTWLILLLVCAGTSWFALQYFLLPQSRDYAPDWQNAQWIQAIDSNEPVAYFRYSMNMSALPDSAFITVTASQVFSIYVNGVYIGANNASFVQSATPHTYMFDIASVLQNGDDTVGIRVANVDQKTPELRANIGVVWGKTTHYYGSGPGWLATGTPALAHPRGQVDSYGWTLPKFDTTQWQAARIVAQPPASPAQQVNPQVYEQPMPAYWLSAGSGPEGYYTQTITLPAGFSDAFIRLVATGKSEVFINDHQYIRWDGQVSVPQGNVANYLEDHSEEAPYRNGLLLGTYAVSPYLHAGQNTIAVHVESPGTSTAKVGLDTLKNAMSIDLLVTSGNVTYTLLTQPGGWHAATTPVDGWTQSMAATQSWSAPILVGKPGNSRANYIANSDTPQSSSTLPPGLVVEVILYSTIAILAAWIALALLLTRRYAASTRQAFESASLVFLPALAVELLLLMLAREPLFNQPFPYTPFWGCVLIGIVMVSIIGLWLQQQVRVGQTRGLPYADRYRVTQAFRVEQTHGLPRVDKSALPADKSSLYNSADRMPVRWVKQNWGLLLIMLIALPMVCYNIGYEPYWQDELSSYYAALNIMQHGFPAFPSGFIYPKGELFSYFLALLMSVLGTTSSVVPRTISVSWYLVSLPMMYLLGLKLFNRRVAWLGTTMLAFSPYALIWARQTRMYEQAQLMVIIVLLAFYHAIKHPERKRPVYVAAGCLVLAYFSHEENFIILPALLFSVLWWTRRGAYGIPVALRQKHWWIAAFIAIAIISVQLLIVYWSHPPVLGTDQSQRPQIQLSADNVPYYLTLLFGQKVIKDGAAPWVASQPWLAVDSLLALLGCVLALVRKDTRARYCAFFLLISSATLIFIFTMQADRYYYPLLPMYYLMGAYAVWSVLQAAWRFARPHFTLAGGQYNEHRQARTPLPVRVLATAIAGVVIASVLVAPMLPISNYNLFVSRTLGLNYRQHYADYNDVSNYMQAHLRPGDVVITVAPAVIVLYYVGQVDYYFSVDRALFLFEKNGEMVETTSGAHPLLNESDFQSVLSSHARIWLISDNGSYQAGVTKNGRFAFPPSDFLMVYEGYGASIYFRDATG